MLVPGAALVGVVGSVGFPRGFGRRDDCPWDGGVVVPMVGLSLLPGPRRGFRYYVDWVQRVGSLALVRWLTAGLGG